MILRRAQGIAGVSAGHPDAVAAGLDALRDGGNAVDAALASSLCQWVVMAPHCGPGGEFLMLHASSEHEVTCYAGWARTPYHVGSLSLTTSGPAAAVVPGALRGAEAASSLAGKLPWYRLFEAALAAADGHKCTDYMAAEYRKVVQRGHASALEAVLGTAHPPSPGDLLRAPALRETLTAIATRGADDFYHGDIAARLLTGAAKDGAALCERDLREMSADVRAVGGRSHGSLDIYVTPWPSQASMVLDLLSAVDVADRPTSTAFAEAVAPLTEKCLTERCTVGLPGTAVSVAADEGGAAAVVVHSLSGTQFGSGWVPEDTGVSFSNRVGTALSTRADLPGAHPLPGALLPHTLSAVHVRTADGRTLTMATPGGDRQIQWLAQALQGVGLGLHATELVEMPRWFVCPEGDRFGVPGGIGSPWYTFAEPGIEWQNATRCAGYEVRPVRSVGGSLQVVERNEEKWHIASDARAGGAASAMPSREP